MRLYEKYRPKTIDDVVGQPKACEQVRRMIAQGVGGRAVWISGPSGAGKTTLARIIHAVEQAQGQRAPTQRFVDRFAAVYTPAVFVLALAVAVGTPLLLGWPP